MYRDGTLEELIKDLEEERASKRLRELDPELLLSLIFGCYTRRRSL